MDKCPKCNGTLSIGVTHMEFEGDKSENTPTIAYNVLPLCCVNPKCDNYSENLNNPKIVIDTIRQKMN